LLSACSGFTQYANAFIHTEAERVEFDDYAQALEMRERARKMYVRARDYCLRRLEVDYAGISERLHLEPDAAIRMTGEDDVPVLYWLGGSWGLAISLGLDRPEMVADLPAVRALMTRALALDEDYGDGAIHGAMLVSTSSARSSCREDRMPRCMSRWRRASRSRRRTARSSPGSWNRR
jgi:hypothetical protein